MRAIGITGSYGGLNAGDEAILTSMVGTLRAAIGDLSLTVFSREASHTLHNHDVDVAVCGRTIGRSETLRHLEGLDLLLLGGGGILYDGEARLYLRQVRLAQEAGIRTMAFAVGAGPLTNNEDQRLMCETLPHMEAVTVRDAGAKRLLRHIGVDCDVEVTADPALLLDAKRFSQTQLLLEGIPPGRRLVGLSLREPGPAAPDLDADGYHWVLAHIADFVAERFEAQIVFIPMERCDVRLSDTVIARMNRADRAHVLRGRYEPGELLGLMEHLTMVIGMRLHVLIFAALAGVPMFALPYAPKVADFLDAIGMAHSVRVSTDSVGALLAAIDRAWDLRDELAAGASGYIPELRRRCRRTLDVALQSLPAPAAPQMVQG